MEKITRTQGELVPKFDNRKSFYGKAKFEIVETQRGGKVYFLYSYNSLVCGIVEDQDRAQWLYVNDNINAELLTSQTTLRHIKEFLKQFYTKKEINTKTELLKTADQKPFDFIELHETSTTEQLSIASWHNYQLATSPETTKFFKNFKGYKQQVKTDSKGKHLLTRSVYGIANWHFLYI